MSIGHCERLGCAGILRALDPAVRADHALTVRKGPQSSGSA